jgi:hypothetical protein
MTTRGRARSRTRFELGGYARRLEAFLEDRASGRAAAARGDGAPPSAAALHARHPDLFGARTVTALASLAEQDGEHAREAQLLLAETIDGHLEAGLADLTDRIDAAERQAIVIWRGERIAYPAVPSRIADTAHRSERNGLDSSYREAMEAINPLREEWFARRRTLLADLGHDDEAALVARAHDFEPDAFVAELQRFLNESETVYYAALRRFLARIDIEQGDGSEADAWHVLRGSGWDALFPQRRLTGAIGATLDGMGLDLDAPDAPRLELGEPAAGSRAGWYGIRVPGEVAVVLRPAAGVDAYRAALHALGHALQRAGVSPDLGLGARRLGDPAVAGGYGFLLEDLLLEPEWLVGELNMDDGAVPSFGDFAAFARLYRLRRDAALHLYELRLTGDPDASLARAYFSGMLSLLTGVNVAEPGYLASVRHRFAAASRTRAAWLAAALASALRREHGAAWWRSAEAGASLRRAWTRGGGWSARDLVAHLGYDRLDWRPVLRHTRTQLIGELSGYGGPNITTRAGTRKV